MTQPVRAKKHLGQHFLCDENIAQKIVQAAIEGNINGVVMEVGPGAGVLTKYMIERPDFMALDVDTESVEYLKKQYPQHANKIMEQDFLEADLCILSGGRSFTVIGNFPYNISSQIMFQVLAHRKLAEVVVGMFQKEVAERIAEKPGTKTYGILSVLLQAFYDITYLFTVPEHVFSPPPKVKSAVIKLVRNQRQELGCDEVLFFKVVKTTFNQRRKTIRNSIKPLLNGKLIQSDTVLLEKRPEQLSVEQFVDLTNLLDQTLKET
jgi:16S rRNA (adenine1518-N6/adenine1519-N6)-dimethyltransferase